MVPANTCSQHFFCYQIVIVFVIYEYFIFDSRWIAQKSNATASEIAPSLNQEQNNTTQPHPHVPVASAQTSSSSTQKSSSKALNQNKKQNKKTKKTPLYRKMYTAIRTRLRTIVSCAVGLAFGMYYVTPAFEGQIKGKNTPKPGPYPKLSPPQDLPPVSPQSAAGCQDPSTLFPLQKLTINSVDRAYTTIFKIAEARAQQLASDDSGNKDAASPDKQLVTAIMNCAATIGKIEHSIASKIYLKPDWSLSPNDFEAEIDCLAQYIILVDNALAQNADPNTIVDCGGDHSNIPMGENKRGYKRPGYFSNNTLTITYPAWIFAIRIGCPYAIIKKLIHHGAKINAIDGEQHNALWAFYDYYWKWCNTFWYSVNTNNAHFGLSRRYYGEAEDALSILNILLKTGIDVETKRQNKSVLSCIFGDLIHSELPFEPRFARVLINNGALINTHIPDIVTDAAGKYILQLAKIRDLKFVKYLSQLRTFQKAVDISLQLVCNNNNVPAPCAKLIQQFLHLYPKDRVLLFRKQLERDVQENDEEDEKEKAQ